MGLAVRRVRSQNFHKEAASFNFFHRFVDSLLVDMSFNVNKEDIFPRFTAGRPGLDLGHADSVRGEWPEQVIERSHLVFYREHQGGLVFSRSLGWFLRED